MARLSTERLSELSTEAVRAGLTEDMARWWPCWRC
jgi:hypothetical protein